MEKRILKCFKNAMLAANSKRVAAYVLWFNGENMEVVDSFIGETAVESGLEHLIYRASSFAENLKEEVLENVDVDDFLDPGCNLYILRVSFKDIYCMYQLNLVERNDAE